MKKTCLAFSLFAWSAAAPALPPSPADRHALERLAADNDAAWTAKDWTTILGQYAEGGTLRVGPNAAVESGKEKIAAFFQTSFSRRPDGFRHLTRIESIEMVTPDLAIADAHVRVERAESGEWTLVRAFSNNSLLVRESGQWKLHSVRAYPLPADP